MGICRSLSGQIVYPGGLVYKPKGQRVALARRQRPRVFRKHDPLLAAPLKVLLKYWGG
jgi:hypothetical protein